MVAERLKKANFQIQAGSVSLRPRFESRLGHGTIYRNINNGPDAIIWTVILLLVQSCACLMLLVHNTTLFYVGANSIKLYTFQDYSMYSIFCVLGCV